MFTDAQLWTAARREADNRVQALSGDPFHYFIATALMLQVETPRWEVGAIALLIGFYLITRAVDKNAVYSAIRRRTLPPIVREHMKEIDRSVFGLGRLSRKLAPVFAAWIYLVAVCLTL